MGLFFSKPKVSKEEFKKVRHRLYSEGFSQRELTEFDKLFSAAFGSTQGVDAKEIDRVIAWLRENPSKTILEPDDVIKIEEAMRARL